MSASDSSTRADQAFRNRGGEAWARLQEQTDAQIDPFGLAAIPRLGLTGGERVLDVGCGCGQTLLELAEGVGPRGHVLGVDISEPMLERARERVAGRDTIELCCADAQTHPFVPADFDAIFSRFGVMFFEDARLAFANLRRALRPRGRLAFVCWQALSLNPWAELPMRAVMRLLGQTAPPAMMHPGLPGPYYLSDPALVRSILSEAGFTAIEIDPLERPLHLGGAMTLDEAVAYSRHIGPAARAAADVAPEMRPAVDAAVSAALAPFATEGGVWVPSAAFIVTARAPG